VAAIFARGRGFLIDRVPAGHASPEIVTVARVQRS
jgi:hypothetical protein